MVGAPWPYESVIRTAMIFPLSLISTVASKVASECPICKEPYNLTELLPRLLGCRHSVCSSCLPKVCGKDNSITCPLCRHVTPVPSGNVEGLLKDLRQVAFLEGPLQGNQQPHVCELCEDQHEATFTCIDCPPQVSLCLYFM